MPSKSKFKSISIKEEFAESIEEFINQHLDLGYRSIAQFLEDAARRRLEELKTQFKSLPRFEKINVDENGVKMLDRELRQVVDVYFKPQGVKCSFHQTDSCAHIDFAISNLEVRRTIRQRRKEGWKLPNV